ncbi:40S ribosomal protein S2 [Fukomys damarensis]|uniref:40S ribosomal protein S2 n=1 Tax=Fukomys damarensis TaxID=885580 RepID=A0A091CNF4_FUKDA|nr:40S ribosomal protein S2 [Fukomys damarensis]
MGGLSSGLRSCGRGRGPGRDRGARCGKAEDTEWILVTKSGRLVEDTKIKSREEIYFSSPTEESEIIDFSPERIPQGWSPAEHARIEANSRGPADQIQGICGRWGLQRSGWCGCKVFQGSSHHSVPGFHCLHAERLLGEQDRQASHCPLRGDRPLGLCVGASDPCPHGHWPHVSPCAREAAADGWD